MANTTQIELGSVVSLWRYPVKSMLGEELNAAAGTLLGCSTPATLIGETNLVVMGSRVNPNGLVSNNVTSDRRVRSRLGPGAGQRAGNARGLPAWLGTCFPCGPECRWPVRSIHFGT